MLFKRPNDSSSLVPSKRIKEEFNGSDVHKQLIEIVNDLYLQDNNLAHGGAMEEMRDNLFKKSYE